MKQSLILIFTIALISPCLAQPTPTATPTPENKEIPVVKFPSEFYQRRLNKKYTTLIYTRRATAKWLMGFNDMMQRVCGNLPALGRSGPAHRQEAERPHSATGCAI